MLICTKEIIIKLCTLNKELHIAFSVLKEQMNGLVLQSTKPAPKIKPPIWPTAL